MEDGAVAEASMDGDVGSNGGAAPSSSGAEDRSGTYSETNNQESGVDEADFLKFDGHHFYMINNNHLVIIGVPEHGNLTLVADMELEGRPLQMMMDGDHLVIISSINSWNIPQDDPLRSIMQTSDGNWRSSNLVKYTVVDISNQVTPTSVVNCSLKAVTRRREWSMEPYAVYRTCGLTSPDCKHILHFLAITGTQNLGKIAWIFGTLQLTSLLMRINSSSMR